MEMVEGGDFGVEKSWCSTHPVTEEVGFGNSGEASQTTVIATGLRATAFVSRALS
jgi:hypothetical protein